VSTSLETVRAIQEALGRGEIMFAIGHLARDVRWSVNVADRGAAPWFGEYRGRRGALAFYEAMSVVDLTTYDVRSIVGDDEVVMVWLHMEFTAPSGRAVAMDEVQVWAFDGAKVREVEFFPDTLAVAAAFA